MLKHCGIDLPFVREMVSKASSDNSANFLHEITCHNSGMAFLEVYLYASIQIKFHRVTYKFAKLVKLYIIQLYTVVWEIFS